MTGELARVSGGVVAVERDPDLAATLRSKLAVYPNARILEADILEISLPHVACEGGTGRLRVYGSLPYYITSPILHLLYSALPHIADIHVIVQREVAERLVAQPGSRDYGYLSVQTQVYTRPEILERIPRSAFRPPPQVESALVRLIPPGMGAQLEMDSPEAFLGFVGVCFRHKRKTLFNNLRDSYPAEQLRATLGQVGLAAKARAEELSLEKLADLYRTLPRAERSGESSRLKSSSPLTPLVPPKSKARGKVRGS
jgi:16S rRNA (adenine1518-N6/adenine1519-N6)-dimethyltransferase